VLGLVSQPMAPVPPKSTYQVLIYYQHDGVQYQIQEIVFLHFPPSKVAYLGAQRLSRQLQTMLQVGQYTSADQICLKNSTEFFSPVFVSRCPKLDPLDLLLSPRPLVRLLSPIQFQLVFCIHVLRILHCLGIDGSLLLPRVVP